MDSSSSASLSKLSSRSLPDLTCPHHDLHLHSQDSSSPSSVKKQPHLMRDNHKLSALLSSSHFRPFFHSSSSSLSSESCHSHSLPPHSHLVSKDATSKPPCEEDYESLKLISNGAYGAVYLVRHKETMQRFAMKKINKLNLVLRNQVEQVFAERDIMSFTDNPFVVSMFCSFETKRHLCMVMEYVEGGDCAILLKNMGPLPVDLARFYFGETLLAVEYLHSFGIVHRDLKPDNLLITAMGHIKLTDFGLSKIGLMNLATNLYEGYLDKEARQFNDKQVFGTPEYIAPEVILRQGYGKPVDWWSMGIILYEFLVGCVPFFGETPEELFAHVINDEPEWPEEDEWPVPDEAKSLITALLMRNPLDRLGTGGAAEVKEHSFFGDMNWEDLLRQKAEFIPHLEGEDDTSYFDTRSERYNHELGEDGESLEETDDSGSLFSSFSSCSPRYHKAYSRIEKELAEERLLKSSSASSIAMEPHPSTKSLPRSVERVHHKGATSTSSSMDVILLRTRSLTVANPMDASKELDNSPQINDDEKQDHRFSLSSSCASSVSGPRDSQRKISVEEGYDSGRKSYTHSTTPELSQNESETDASPKIERRKRGLSLRSNLPRFSICISDKDFLVSAAAVSAAAAAAVSTPCTPSIREIPPTDDDATVTDDDNLTSSGNQKSYSQLQQQHRHYSHHNSFTHPTSPTIPIPGLPSSHQRSRSVIKSASVSGLSLIIPPPDEVSPMSLTVGKASPGGGGTGGGASGSKVNAGSGSRSITSPGNSSASSRDTSPNRDIANCLTSQLKPPIIIRRGARGFGFTLRAIRVYFGDTDVYTLHHLVMHVENNSPAFEAGLRPGDLITHINGESIQGLLHPQVLQLVLSGGDKINIRSTPLENTTIKTGGRKRNHKTSKLIRRQMISKHRRTPPIRRTDSEKRKSRGGNLFRRLSSKRASAEIQQLMTNPISPIALSPSRSFQSLAQVTPGYSSQSSSPGSSVPNSPALVNSPNFQPRPSSLYGLKNKLVKTCRHHQTSMQSPRRKSCGHIPLSPLARTPSPSVHLAAVAATSPTRSPSPLAFPPGHLTSSSTTTALSGSGGRKKVFHQLVNKSYQ